MYENDRCQVEGYTCNTCTNYSKCMATDDGGYYSHPDHIAAIEKEFSEV